jgi:hypothetical protein
VEAEVMPLASFFRDAVRGEHQRISGLPAPRRRSFCATRLSL